MKHYRYANKKNARKKDIVSLEIILIVMRKNEIVSISLLQ